MPRAGTELQRLGYGLLAFAALLAGLGLAQRTTIFMPDVPAPAVALAQDPHKIEALFAPRAPKATCTPVAFRSDMRSSCAMGRDFNTCGDCREDFEEACLSDGLGVAMREGETLDQCALRLITERNTCEAWDLVPDGTEGIWIEVSRYDGKTYYIRDCFYRRHPEALPNLDNYRGDCGDTNLDWTDAHIEACVADMERQWRAGNDFPEKNPDIQPGDGAPS